MYGAAKRTAPSILPLSCLTPGRIWGARRTCRRWPSNGPDQPCGSGYVSGVTLAGTFGGILVSNRLTNYRIEQLEKKVAEHNNVVERTYKLEGQMTEVQHDIRDLKGVKG